MVSVHLVYFLIALSVCSVEFIVLPYHQAGLCRTMQEPVLACHQVISISSTNGKGIHVNAFRNGSNGGVRFKIIANLDTSRVESCLYKEATRRTFLYPSTIENCRQRKLLTIEHVVSSQCKLPHIGGRRKFMGM